MRAFVRKAIAGLLLACVPAMSWAQTATILPNALQQFVDTNGQPLNNGSVYFYVPNTTTPKVVWTDSTEKVPLPQPVPLTVAGYPSTGSAVSPIYGDGCYRQVVRDANNLPIWDFPTCSTGSGGGGGGSTSSIGDGLAVGTVIIWNGLTLPNNYVYASGQALSRATYSQLLSVLTLQQTSAVCQASNTTLSGLTDTSQIPVGAAIEGSCILPGTTVVSKSTNAVVMSAAATASLTITATFFPYGNGDGASTFNVPNYNGLYLLGRCNMNGTTCSSISSGFYGSVDPNALNAKGGNQSLALNIANLPTITSNVTGVVVDAAGSKIVVTSATPSNTAASLSSTGFIVPTVGTGQAFAFPTTLGQNGTAIAVSTGTTTAPFSRLPPSATVNYAIKALQDSTTKLNLNVLAASRLATTTALAANTYNNGASGVGATLTANANGALSIDSTAVATSDQVLIKNEATPSHNGIYTVVQTGDGSHPYVLVRATFFDQASEMIAGSYTVIIAGNANAGSSWILQNSVNTIGTDPIIFNLFSSTATFATQAANTVFAGPTSGASAAPTFRPLVQADLPLPGASLTLHVNTSSGIDSGLCTSGAPCLTIGYAASLVQSQQVRSPSGGIFPIVQIDNCATSANFTESPAFLGTGYSLNGAIIIKGNTASPGSCVWNGANILIDNGANVGVQGFTLRTTGGNASFFQVSKGGILSANNNIYSSAVGGTFFNLSGGFAALDPGTHQVGDGAACTPNCFTYFVQNRSGQFIAAPLQAVTVPNALTFTAFYSGDGTGAITNFPAGALAFSGTGSGAGSTGLQYQLTNGALPSFNGTTFPGASAGTIGPFPALTFTGTVNVNCTSCGNIQINPSTNTTSGVDYVQAGTSAGDNFIASIAAEASNTTVLFGQTIGNWGLLRTQGANNQGLLVGTNTAAPVIIGTNNTARVTIDGSSGSTAFSSPSMGALTINPSTNSTSGFDYFQAVTTTIDNTMSMLVAESLNNGTFFGQTIGNWGMIRAAGASNLGLAIGTAGNLPLILGTNNTARMTISGAGITTFSGALTLNSALTYGGVTLSNSVTGTGSMALSASPTFTGTVTAPTFSGSLTGHASLDLALTGGTMSGAIAMGTNAITGLTTLACAGACTFQSNGSAFAGNITTGQQWFFGGTNNTPPTGPILTISKNTAALPALGTPTGVSGTAQAVVTLGGVDGSNSDLVIQSFGGNSSVRYFSAANTAGSRQAITSGTVFATNFAYGYNGSVYLAAAGFAFQATDTFSGSVSGTRLDLYATTTGTTGVAIGASVGGGLMVGTATDPGAGSVQINAQIFMPNITTSSAAQTGTVCWTTGTGKFTVDTTVGCLTSIMAAKNVTERLSSVRALEIVDRLSPFAFRYKNGWGDGGRYEQFGLGAEEVALVDERLAGRDPQGNLQGVRYQELTAVLVGAIKELKADNDNLHAELAKKANAQ